MRLDYPLAEQSAYRVCQDHLTAFIRTMNPNYRPAWFHRRLAQKFEELVSQRNRRLMVFMPPRHGKSEIMSVMGPAWAIGRNPDLEVMTVSYASALAERFSRRSRNLLPTTRYQRIFPGVLPAKDSSAVDEWGIQGRAGVRYAVGLDGPASGRGAQLLLFDDLLKNARQAFSARTRAHIQEELQISFFTRLMPGTSIALTMTRFHQQDPAGILLAEEQAQKRQIFPWEIMVLPAWNEETQTYLWPERYTHDEYEEFRYKAGKHGWAALFMQDPLPMDTAVIDPDWFKQIALQDAPKRYVRLVLGVDPAVSTRKTSDDRVVVPMGMNDDGQVFVFPPYRSLESYPKVRDVIVSRAKAMGVDSVGIEVNGQQEGWADDLERLLPGVVIVRCRSSVDKVSRASDWTPIAESGLVTLVDDGTGWINQALDEFGNFPVGSADGVKDDLIDAIGCGFKALRLGGSHAILRRGGIFGEVMT